MFIYLKFSNVSCQTSFYIKYIVDISLKVVYLYMGRKNNSSHNLMKDITRSGSDYNQRGEEPFLSQIEQ